MLTGLEDPARNHAHSSGVLSFWVMGTAPQWQDAGYLPSCRCKKCHCLAAFPIGWVQTCVAMRDAERREPAWLVATTTLPSGNASATCEEYLNCSCTGFFEKNFSTSLWTRTVAHYYLLSGDCLLTATKRLVELLHKYTQCCPNRDCRLSVLLHD